MRQKERRTKVDGRNYKLKVILKFKNYVSTKIYVVEFLPFSTLTLYVK